jgi:hypothetical protein
MSTELEIVPTSAIESIARAEVDIQITTAKKFPRQLTTVKQSMLSFATLDQETAESCFYTLPRGGKNVQGPSVRLAEIAVSCYQNLRAGSRIIQVVSSGDNPHVVVQSVCHDLEKNVAVTVEKRRRIVKKKAKDKIDEDDINLAANAGAAIAFRDAVFKVIPGALIKPVYEQAKRVAIGDAKTLADRRVRAVESFGKMGVTKDRIFSKLGKKSVDEIDLADLETLLGLHNAIKDGEASVDEVFPLPQLAAAPAPSMAESTEQELADAGLAPAQPKPAPEPVQAAQPAASAATTSQQELQALVESVPADFTALQLWGIESGVIPGADSLGSYDEISSDLVRRLLNAKKGLTRGLQQAMAKRGVAS